MTATADPEAPSRVNADRTIVLVRLHPDQLRDLRLAMVHRGLRSNQEAGEQAIVAWSRTVLNQRPQEDAPAAHRHPAHRRRHLDGAP